MKKFIFCLVLLFNNSFAADNSTYKLLIGFGPGAMDTLMRSVTADLEKTTSLQFVTINRSGAGGMIAVREYWEKKDDNMLLGVAVGQILIYPVFNPQSYYLDKLKMIGPVFYSPMAIAVSPNSTSKIKTLDDLFNKRIPRQRVNIGVPGEAYLFVANEIAKHSHHDIQPIMFKGGGEILPQLLGGHVDMQIDSFAYFKPKLPSVVLIANTSNANIGDVPSLQKYIPNFTINSFYGIAVSKDVDTKFLEKEINKGFALIDKRVYLDNDLMIDTNLNSDYIDRELIPKYRKLSKQYGTTK